MLKHTIKGAQMFFPGVIKNSDIIDADINFLDVA